MRQLFQNKTTGPKISTPETIIRASILPNRPTASDLCVNPPPSVPSHHDRPTTASDPMLALAAILTFQTLFALSCLLFFLYLITARILRRPGRLPPHNLPPHRRPWRRKPPTAPPALTLVSQQRQQRPDLESDAGSTADYTNPFDSSPTATSCASSMSSSSSSSSAIDRLSAGTGGRDSETVAAATTTTPFTWRDPWRWRFGTSSRSSRRKRGRGGSGSGSGSGSGGGDVDEEERRMARLEESPGLSPLGLGKYFFEGGVGIRDV